MWQRFTERARKAVFYAQEEAQRFGAQYVSTEHLILGLIREKDSVAARILVTLGIALNDLRKEVEKLLPADQSRPSQDMTLTPRAKRVIDLAYDEARNLNNNYIGTEHLLLGLIREEEGLAGRVLQKLGADLQKAREEVSALQLKEGQRKLESEEKPKPPPRTRDPISLRSLADEYRKVVEAFHLESLRRGEYIAEMLALQILSNRTNEAAQVLGRMNVSVIGLTDSIERAILFAHSPYPDPSLNDILVAAQKEAKAISGKEQSAWGPSELFLGILAVSRQQFRSMFEAHGVTLETFRTALLEVRKGN